MVSGCKRTIKAFERIQHPRKITMIIVKIIPNDWSALSSQGPQDPNLSEPKKSKKGPIEGVTF